MPWIRRNGNGDIAGITKWRNEEHTEFITEDAQEYLDLLEAKQAFKESEQIRATAIEVEKETSGLKKITVDQAYNFIDAKLDAASTAAQTKEALREILKEMIPFLLQ